MTNFCAILLLHIFGLALASGECSYGREVSAMVAGNAADQVSLLQDRQFVKDRGELHKPSLLQTAVGSEARSAPAKAAQTLAERKAEALVVILGKSVADSMAKRKTTSSRRMSYLDGMLETAEGIARESQTVGVTPTVTKFVDAVMENIEETILPAILDEHEIDQQLLVTLWAPIDEAEGHAAPIERAMYEEAIQKHSKCRAAEAELCGNITECQGRQDTAASALAEAEAVVTGLKEQIWGHDSGGCGTDVNQSEISFRQAIRPILHQWLAADGDANSARGELDDITQECKHILEEQLEQREMCDNQQRDLESLSCAYASAVATARHHLLHGYEHAVTTYEVAVENVLKMEIDRKKEYTTLHHSMCLLNHTYAAGDLPCDEPEQQTAEEVAGQIAGCHSLDVDTTFLDITYNTTQDAPEAPEMPMYPCTTEYLSVQYGSLAPVDTCGGPSACHECVGLFDPPGSGSGSE